MKPNIYILIEAPVLGELGPDSTITREKVCADCGKLQVTNKHIDFKFDRWNGEDFISAYGIYFVSDRLHEALLKENVRGLEFKNITTSKATKFKIGKKAYQNDLPAFYHITITGRAKSPDPWWKKISTCKICGNEKWLPTKDGLRSGKGPALTGTKKDVLDPLPRRVFKESWAGDDVFLLQDPVPYPMVTQHFKDILDTLNNDKLFYRNTEWS